jgi:hypothetical protein
MKIDSSSTSGLQETEGVFTDGRAENAIGVNVRQRTFSWNDNYVMMEYVITNISSRTIDNLAVGLAFEWLQGFFCSIDSNSHGGFFPEYNLGYVYSGRNYNQPCSRDTGRFWGLTVLSDEGANSSSALVRPRYAVTGISDYEKYAALTGGIAETLIQAGSDEQLLQIISTGPYSLLPGETDTAAFAVIAGNTLSELKAGAVNSSEVWRAITQSGVIPDTYLLSQNYPNPFNNSTVIEYSLPAAAHVTINIYNLLGQKVVTLIDKSLPAGNHQVRWGGKDGAGEDVASGVYFYRILTHEFVESKKMLLLK